MIQFSRIKTLSLATFVWRVSTFGPDPVQGSPAAVCSEVTLSVSGSVVLTSEATLLRLTLRNDSTSTTISDIQLEPSIQTTGPALSLAPGTRHSHAQDTFQDNSKRRGPRLAPQTARGR